MSLVSNFKCGQVEVKLNVTIVWEIIGASLDNFLLPWKWTSFSSMATNCILSIAKSIG